MAEAAPPPYSATPPAQNKASISNKCYNKGPSDSFLGRNSGAANVSQIASPNTSGYIKGPSDSYLARNQASGNLPQQASPKMSNGTSKPLFPQSFGFYHAPGTHSDMMIALSADSSQIFHVSTHGGFSSRPSVVLHSGASESFPAMASADFHSFSSTVDVMLFNQPVALQREGAFSSITFFQYPMPQPNGQNRLERFEWKSSSGPEVQSLQGRGHGMKCVRVRTGEVVAAWARANLGNRKKGKMCFLQRHNLGDEKFETMVVISVLSIMEKARRSKNTRAGAAGGVAGGAAGAGGGF